MLSNDRGNSKIGTILVIIYMVALVGSIYIFSQTKPILAVVSLGTLVILIGIACMVGGKQEGFKIGNIIGAVLCSFLGSCMVVLPLLFLYAPSFANVDAKKVILAIGMILTIAIGFTFWIALYSLTLHKMMRCRNKVSAYVDDYETDYKAGQINLTDLDGVKRRKSARSMIFTFHYMGREYRVQESLASNMDLPTVGSQVILWINPENPEEFFRGRPLTFIALFMMGAIALGVGIACLYAFVI